MGNCPEGVQTTGLYVVTRSPVELRQAGNFHHSTNIAFGKGLSEQPEKENID
jgi:hypothetical protein